MSIIDALTGGALTKIQTTLDRIERKVNHVSAQENELDQALQALGDEIATELQNAVDAIVAKVGDKVDLTDETANVAALTEKLRGLSSQLNTAGTPPEPTP